MKQGRYSCGNHKKKGNLRQFQLITNGMNSFLVCGQNFAFKDEYTRSINVALLLGILLYCFWVYKAKVPKFNQVELMKVCNRGKLRYIVLIVIYSTNI